ncbi:MAG TPA: outer membrane protein assembly factor BamD [Methylomirabilota bacterium]|nr:outer membrane protein assembly factor BamD [Methylomirabilota bacterium]
MSDVAGVATQQDLLELRTELGLVQQSALRTKTDTEAALAQADRRQRERATEEDRQLQSLNQRLDALTTALTALGTRVDELNTRTEALGRQPRTATPVPSPLPPATTARPATPAPPSAQTEPPAGARPSTNALQPQDIYQAAYIDFSKGSYPLAIAGFREFLRRFPDHQLAGAAQYWIGEAYFSLARGYVNASQADKATEALEQAVQEFRKVQANYARSDKAPTALYKEALALLDLKQPAVAQARLQYLVDNFPQAEEAPLARERLAALKPETR